MPSLYARLAAALILVSLAHSASAQIQPRIAQAVESSRTSVLPGTARRVAPDASDAGPIEAGVPLRGMTIDFAPSAEQQAALTATLKAQQDPASPSYRHWLTPQQYADRFGMSESDIAKVKAWLESQGFVVDKVADSRNSIWFSGTAAQAEAAFHTPIHNYLIEGETHFANSAAISLPSAFAALVTQVGGLNNFRLKPQLIRPRPSASNAASPEFTSGISGSHFLAPGDFGVIYDLNPLYTAGFTGTGQTIGVIGQTNIVPADITSFRAAAGLPVNDPTVFLVPTSSDPGISYSDLPEADLDLEWSGGVAPGATIVYINSTGVLQSLQYAIANKINGIQIPILTMSYAGCEAGFTAAAVRSLESFLQQANLQGQTVVNSSGDSGAAACDIGATIATATQGIAVNYPTSSASVTGIGGTEFMGDGSAASPITGAGQYWSANGSNDLVTSAKSYIPEMAWNDTAISVANGGGLSSGGGGVSLLFTKPSWQAGVAGIPADGQRDVPDISFASSAYHDPYLYCTQIQLASTPTVYSSSCANGFRISDPGQNDDGSLSVVGGTSVASPAFAGILALIEQKLGTPQGLGNINPVLYTLASSAGTYASAFHDITSGDNQVPCSTGSNGCTGGVLGYTAGAGYDLATGLGSVDGANLATALSTVAVKAGSTTTVTVLPVAPVVGTATVLTATVTPNTGSGVPSGSVSFTVDGAFFTTVPLTDGAASATTNFSTGGAHTVIADYTGDTVYYASSTTSTITVAASPTAAPTTTTLAASPASIALYGPITLTATVQSQTAGTVAGTVTFTIAGKAIGTATIVSGASGVGTATLVLSSATPALGFTAGTDTIVAAYGGDSTYGASAGTLAITVTNPGLTLAVADMTIPSSSPGNSGTSTVTVNSTGGYAGTVTLTATSTSTLAANYGFASDSLVIPAGGSANTTITLQTIQASAKQGVKGNLRSGLHPMVAAAGVAFGAIFLLGLPGFRRRRWSLLLPLLLLGGLSAGLGCGGGGSSGATPAGSYVVTVTATDSVNPAITASTNFTLTIK